MMMHGDISNLLIASGVGYWVLTTANKEKGQAKKAGQLLAGIIILVSLAGVACRVISFARMRGYCPSGTMSCPFTGKPMGSAQPAK